MNTINTLIQSITDLNERLDKLEKKSDREDRNLLESIKIIRSQLLRIRNKEVINDDYILSGKGYNDYSPHSAFSLYQESSKDFILLDVSRHGHRPQETLPEAIHIPLEELNVRLHEIENKSTPILVISEDGTRSILACQMLNEHEYYNVNNISGGYKFWPWDKMQGQDHDTLRKIA